MKFNSWMHFSLIYFQVVLLVLANDEGYCTKDDCKGNSIEEHSGFSSGNLTVVNVIYYYFLIMFIYLTFVEMVDEWRELKSKISQAVADYVPCKSKNCSCFTDLVASDLLPFQNGITKAMLEKSKEKYYKFKLKSSRIALKCN